MDKNKDLERVLLLEQIRENNLLIAEAKSKVSSKQTNNNNAISNPISNTTIYRVTTTCHKSVNNIWSYKAKIYFRKGQTKAVHEIVSLAGMDSLLREVKKQMQILHKS